MRPSKIAIQFRNNVSNRAVAPAFLARARPSGYGSALIFPQDFGPVRHRHGQRQALPPQSPASPRLSRPFRRASWRPSGACWTRSAAVYESYGFSALETPAFEYTDALGKFLPDVDRPNAGVFSLRDDDEQWMSLRYDLTAPLARYVAENFQTLPKPFRRYQVGPVWRNEKPGPGRYREFTQFDADTVGSNSPAADAELLMMTCDALEALGLKRGEYVVKINSRKLLDGDS